MSRSRGDVNNDGAIDTLDATAVLSHLVNLEGYILTDPCLLYTSPSPRDT